MPAIKIEIVSRWDSLISFRFRNNVALSDCYNAFVTGVLRYNSRLKSTPSYIDRYGLLRTCY